MKRIRAFFEKQGFFIMLAVCAGIIVASGLWARSLNTEVKEPLADVSTEYAQRLADAEKLKMVRPVPATPQGESAEGALLGFSGAAWLPTLARWGAHEALDLPADRDAPASAARDGTVTAAYRDRLWGGVVEIAHADGLVTRYSALRWPAQVKAGDTVRAGQAIGAVGVAEAESDAPHVHFAAWLNGVPIDPAPHIVN